MPFPAPDDATLLWLARLEELPPAGNVAASALAVVEAASATGDTWFFEPQHPIGDQLNTVASCHLNFPLNDQPGIHVHPSYVAPSSVYTTPVWVPGGGLVCDSRSQKNGQSRPVLQRLSTLPPQLPRQGCNPKQQGVRAPQGRSSTAVGRHDCAAALNPAWNRHRMTIVSAGDQMGSGPHTAAAARMGSR